MPPDQFGCTGIERIVITAVELNVAEIRFLLCMQFNLQLRIGDMESYLKRHSCRVSETQVLGGESNCRIQPKRRVTFGLAIDIH